MTTGRLRSSNRKAIPASARWSFPSKVSGAMDRIHLAAYITI